MEAKNTDKEIWRKKEGDYYSPSIYITSDGQGIGINVGGRVIVAPIEEWHKALLEYKIPITGIPMSEQKNIEDEIKDASPEPKLKSKEILINSSYQRIKSPMMQQKCEICGNCEFYNKQGHCLKNSNENDLGNDVDSNDKACAKFQLKSEAIEEITTRIIELKKEFDITKNSKIIKTKPTHGNCCTCQGCGQSHDDCCCQQNNIIELFQIIDSQTNQIKKLRNTLVCTESDLGYYMAIMDGTWPSSIEILKRSLEKAVLLTGESL